MNNCSLPSDIDRANRTFNLQSQAVKAVRDKELERGQLFADDEVVAQVREYLRRKEEEQLWLGMMWGLRADGQFQHKKATA